LVDPDIRRTIRDVTSHDIRHAVVRGIRTNPPLTHAVRRHDGWPIGNERTDVRFRVGSERRAGVVGAGALHRALADRAGFGEIYAANGK
jgi:hypothetical protein